MHVHYEHFRDMVRLMVEEEPHLLVQKNKKMLSHSKTSIPFSVFFQSRGSFWGKSMKCDIQSYNNKCM